MVQEVPLQLIHSLCLALEPSFTCLLQIVTYVVVKKRMHGAQREAKVAT